MTLRNWLWIGVALAAALWLAGEGEADTEVEGGWGSGDACEQNVTFFLNATVTNDDSTPLRYKVTISASGIGFDPNQGTYDLLPGESATFESQAVIIGGSSYKNVAVEIETRVSPYGIDVPSNVVGTNGVAVQIPQCPGVGVAAAVERVVGERGSELALAFNITNSGNYVDDFVISLEGLPVGWEVRYSVNETLVGIGSWDSQNITVFVTPRSGGEATLRLVARTSLAGYNTSAYAEVTIVVPREWEGLVLVGLGAIGVGAAGAVLFNQWYRGRKPGAEGVGVTGRAADGPASGGGADQAVESGRDAGGTAEDGRAAKVPESARASEAPPVGEESAGEAP